MSLSRPSHIRIWWLALAIAGLCIFGSITSQSLATVSCGTVTANGGSVDASKVVVRVTVLRGSAKCSVARRVIRDIVNGNGVFHHGSSNATSYFIVAGGWKCPPPRVGSAYCTRRHTQLRGRYNPD
ncbi:MAG: hypothetical protein JWN65_2719 [Solirubrobacterales bacterium]|nr:hypothetical protein [Solirubrobacterales bacterium]